MGLASQSIRSGSRRSHMSRRRRRRPGRWLFLLFLVAVVGTGWWWFTTPAEDQKIASAAEDATTTARPASTSDQASTTRTLDPVTRPRTPRPRPTATETSSTPPVVAERTPKTTTPPKDVATAAPTNQGKTPVDLDRTTARESSNPMRPPASTSDPAAGRSAPRIASTAEPARDALPKKTAVPRVSVRPAPAPTSSGASTLAEALAKADDDPLAARRLLTEAWTRGLVGDDRRTAQLLSKRLANATLLVDAKRSGSPYATPYRIKRGDAMSRIVRKHDVTTNLDFVARINGIKDLNRIRENQEIWLPRGLFHVVADRSDGDLAVHQEIDGVRHLLLVVPVTLGRDDLTPDILFQVRKGSKRTNPSWTDPASGVRWAAADPRNPVGEFWIGLEPADPSLRGDPKYQGFGLHGTGPKIEFGAQPTSGSMQVREADAQILFELLRSGRSTIDVRP